MEYLLLIFCIIIQVGIGSYILLQDVRSRLHRLFALFMLVNLLGTFSSLLRLVPTDSSLAARLGFSSLVIIFVWTATFLVIAIMAIFYQSEALKRAFRVLFLPVSVALALTIIGIVAFNALSDQTAILQPLAQDGLYTVDLAAFPFAVWSFGYQLLCSVISIILLLVTIVRGRGVERYSALILGAATLLFSSVGVVSGALLTNRLQIAVPAFCGAALSIHFGYVILRYRLFSARRVAIGIALDKLNDGLLILGTDQTVLDCNRVAVELLDVPKALILNRSIDQVLRSSPFSFSVWRTLHDVLRQSLRDARTASTETEYLLKGKTKIVVNEVAPIEDSAGHLQGYVWVLYDITERRQSAREIERRNQELQDTLAELRSTNEAQNELLETIRTLSAPAVPVLQGIVVLPLSGHISSDRAVLIMSNLLDGIRDYDAKVAIIDITGVPNVDTSVANHLIQAARAASLMGCRPLLVGIRPEIAQVIVELGIDMGGLRTFSDLQSGVEYALQALGRSLVDR
ncbi:MAG: PAS domain-containing protein [Anaerolineae bacterium]|nr:PAS domain-containing protein [Anaerolineae bacterium]